MGDVQDAGVRIARIVKIIDDVAFQTNLLALNAAVEAARAGRQGKGFAVVAEEVRNLAGRSAKAAKDTASMVEDITERIGNAGAYINKLEEILSNIVQDAIRMADATASASAASVEQTEGIQQVNYELSQMDTVTHNTMTAAEQTATSVRVLTRQAGDLRQMIEKITSEFLSDKITASHEETLRADAFKKNSRQGGTYVLPRIPLTESEEQEIRPSRPAQPTETGFRTPSSAATDDWDIASELESPSILPELLKSDSLHQQQQEQNNPFPAAALRDNRHDSSPPIKPNKEGDRLVQPTKKIILDDSEFGRY